MADTNPTSAPERAAHPVLTVIDGAPTTTSLEVATFFGRRHKHVLDAIRALVEQLPADHGPNFRPMIRDVTVGKGAVRREHFFVLTFDAFILLAMGFAGPKALQVKVAYIDEFNRLRAAATEARTRELTALAAEQTRQLRIALDDATGSALDFEAELKDTQQSLIKSQAGQIRLLNRINHMQYRHSRKEAVRLAIDMERRGEPRDRIQAATGLNNNYLRQIVFRARAAGDLPPAPVGLADHLADAAASSAQRTLDLGVRHG